MNDNMLKRLQGIQDSRGMQGILSRGQNIYNSGSFAAQKGGGPQFGRPVGGPQLVGPNSILQRMMGITTPPMNQGGNQLAAVNRRLNRSRDAR